MRKSFLVAAAALMLAGCAKDLTQSEFSADDLKNDALPQGTVVGTVKYDAGAYKDSKGVIFNENLVPAAGKQVKIEVSNAEYVAGSAGNQTFITDIDKDGKFSYSLPLGLNATQVKVSVIPFYAEKKVVSAGEIVSIPNALYNVGTGPIANQLTNKDIKSYDFIVTSDATVDERMSQTVKVTGRVLVYQWVKDGTDYVKNYKSNDKKWKLTCDVQLYDNFNNPTQSYTMTGIQTNTEGEFSFNISLPDNWKDMPNKPRLTVSTKAELDNNFTGKYYVIADTEWKSQTCTVLYPVAEKTLYVTDNNEIVPLNFGDLNIRPELQDKSKIKGIGNPNIDKDGNTTLYNQGALITQWNYNYVI